MLPLAESRVTVIEVLVQLTLQYSVSALLTLNVFVPFIHIEFVIS